MHRAAGCVASNQLFFTVTDPLSLPGLAEQREVRRHEQRRKAARLLAVGKKRSKGIFIAGCCEAAIFLRRRGSADTMARWAADFCVFAKQAEAAQSRSHKACSC